MIKVVISLPTPILIIINFKIAHTLTVGRSFSKVQSTNGQVIYFKK
jgi:hypothetical protein